VDEFSDMHIDQDQDYEEIPHVDVFMNKIPNHHIIQFPSNYIPKRPVPLERLFDRNDVVVKVEGSTEEADVSNLSMEKRAEYVRLLKEFDDVFDWTYEDLRTYDTNIIQHKIPLKEHAKPFKQKLRQINPMLLPIMEKEFKKLLDAHIIIPLRFSEWVGNLVSVKKKNGEIKLCVDFRNLNRSSKKDNYPLPKMEHILQRVTGSDRMSMVDGFFSYNQISILPEDREKTTFTTHWGTFMYAKVHFRLMNVGATLQRAMDIAFIE
jgi:hypothetical protein